jgi:hypothetical protein
MDSTGGRPHFSFMQTPQVHPDRSAKRSNQILPRHFQESFRSFIRDAHIVFVAFIVYLLLGPPILDGGAHI